MNPLRGGIMVVGFVAVLLGGCAYGHYMGLHGPSIRSSPEVHQGVRADADCLACHDPDRDPVGPPTSHPQFTGCLKCHDDPLKAEVEKLVVAAVDVDL